MLDTCSIHIRVDLIDMPLDLLKATEEDGVDDAAPDDAHAQSAVGSHAGEADGWSFGFARAGGEEGFLVDCLCYVDGVDLRTYINQYQLRKI